MLAESNGIGLVCHVFTSPDQRRKGAAGLLLPRLVADFDRRGGAALYLSTGFDSFPYRLYERHGFRSVAPACGSMCWRPEDQARFEARLFRPASVRLERFGLRHWPALSPLATLRHPAHVRVAAMDILGPTVSDAGAVAVLAAMDSKAANRRDQGARACVAVSEASGVPVAIASLRPDRTFWEQVDMVDLFCAPGFEAALPELYGRLGIDTRRTVMCLVDEFWPAKETILRACGLSSSHPLRRHLKIGPQVHDVQVWMASGQDR